MKRSFALAFPAAFAALLLVLEARAAPSTALPAPKLGGLAQYTAVHLSSVESPLRDLDALTVRLKLGGVATIPSSVNASPPNYSVGSRQQFYIANVAAKSYYLQFASIRFVTEHAYWYVVDSYAVDAEALKATARHFEEHIYPTDRRVFGAEAAPGIDNDTHITILIAPLAGAGGYFSTADAYPKIVNPFSNQRDMIYISGTPSRNTADPGNYFEATLAHEFQHMIEWNVNPDRDVWLDEGNSEIAMYINGYDPGGAEASFLYNPDTQLNAWDEPSRSSAHYGASYLYLRYLMSHFGGEDGITGVLRQNGLGLEALDSLVRLSGESRGFEGTFKDWLVENIKTSHEGVGKYRYAPASPARIEKNFKSVPASLSSTVHQYGADYVGVSKFSAPSVLTFNGQSTVPVLAARPYAGQRYWYANRRDSGDATLTREFDLRKLKRASLQFRAWFDIEQYFDYAYPEASLDGGKSWKILPGRFTTTANPNGNAFGAGWTGKSGGGSAPRWVQESIDLTAYAGRQVLVRFEYVTDEGYNRPGLALDEIRVPELGFSDGAETDGAWNAQGFVAIGPDLPQRWYVAFLPKGASKATEMAVSANGTGSLELPAGEGTVIVSALAPKTTELAQYTLALRRK